MTYLSFPVSLLNGYCRRQLGVRVKGVALTEANNEDDTKIIQERITQIFHLKGE